jgi:hypothetical protein
LFLLRSIRAGLSTAAAGTQAQRQELQQQAAQSGVPRVVACRKITGLQGWSAMQQSR